MTQANDKWWDSSIYTYVDVDYDGESESVSNGYHIEAIVAEAERRGYERAMEEVKEVSASSVMTLTPSVEPEPVLIIPKSFFEKQLTPPPTSEVQ